MDSVSWDWPWDHLAALKWPSPSVRRKSPRGEHKGLSEPQFCEHTVCQVVNRVLWLEVRRPGSNISLVAKVWARHVTSLSPRFLTCKKGGRE